MDKDFNIWYDSTITVNMGDGANRMLVEMFRDELYELSRQTNIVIDEFPCVDFELENTIRHYLGLQNRYMKTHNGNRCKHISLALNGLRLLEQQV